VTDDAGTLSGARGEPRTMGKLAEASVIFAAVFAVAAFGGAEPSSFAVVEILLLGTAAFFVAFPGYAPAAVPHRNMAVPMALGLLVLFQLSPLPASWLERFAGRAGLGAAGNFSQWSLDAWSTRSQFLILLTCFAAFYLVQAGVSGRASRERLVTWLLILGAFEAFYGLVQSLTGWQQIFTYLKQSDLEEATGTYINRNHYAGMLEMILPFSLALAHAEIRKLRGGREGHIARGWKVLAEAGAARLVLWLSMGVVLLTALLFSRSRMGILAATVSLLVMASLAAAARLPGRSGAALLAAVLGVSVGLAIWIGPGPIVERFSRLGQEATAHQESRPAIWRDAAGLVRQRFWLGWGLGTFPVAFPSVQTAFPGKFVNHAHNDYVEWASDLGVPAAALFFLAILGVLLRTVRAFLSSERGLEQAVALSCAGSIFAMLVHSAADFNLYVPANALLFAVVLGLAVTTVPRPSPSA